MGEIMSACWLWTLIVINLAFAILFAYSAVVQWNDANPWPFIVLYSVSVILCVLATVRRLHSSAVLTGTMLVVSAVSFVYLFVRLGTQGARFSGKVSDDYGIDNSGLLLVGIWHLANSAIRWVWHRKGWNSLDKVNAKPTIAADAANELDDSL
eukprot:TRINITY_DN18611_c0_g1_i1.p1 TRINITY_DN18611_c0_g1~~TRINITY_DN18611_c0_g1_i1.p1  ORF type:complete len:153 (+),score=39.32 TRINITY_DN18611_c0_g1_i1:57-515(+)